MSASSYHHGNLREALVEAAVEAARANGPDGVALRELARTVGVSHSAAYRHFSHRDELVSAVAVRAMAGLVASMQRRLDVVEQVGSADDVLRARRRLIGVGQGYVAFALGEPGLFRCAFAAKTAAVLNGDVLADRSVNPYGLLSEMLDGLVDVGFLSPEARVGAEMTCWSAVHGFSALHLDGPLGEADDVARDEALDHVLAAIDRSYAASTGTPIRPDDDIFARG
ncbi:TetR/AcrR family transcriptional regulator [Aeromicrobium fastidiosum]|uniref:TetR/AcrR family transcriptional regulator n=1 Tax=Aeromicrobium fastidiosum TaxID=52699 RepID=UPI00202384F9|nr:TetR/AcrR family transcriptional regulator [Aeromicrobium fastidiosum]MCL8251810.1 TetR/AcrR family transcriptional regulator [Aeromicrobium fastidiosum]